MTAINGREIRKVICSCGGEYVTDKTSKEEDKKYGCSRPNCCTEAMRCNRCRTRLIFSLHAPDIDNDM